MFDSHARLAVLALPLLLLAGVPAAAQPASSGEARLGAVALEPVSKDVSLKIELADNSEIDLRLEGELRELLADRGWNSVRGPQWPLTLTTTEVAVTIADGKVVYRRDPPENTTAQ